MRGRSARPLSRAKRAVLARNHRQPKKPTLRDRLSPEVGHLKLADHRDCQASLGIEKEGPPFKAARSLWYSDATFRRRLFKGD